MLPSIKSGHRIWLFWLCLFTSNSALAISKVGIRVDCLAQISAGSSASQDCFNVSELSLRIDEQVGESIKTFIKINPFGTPVANLDHVPRGSWISLPTYMELGSNIIDDFGVFWKVRSRLTLGVEQFSGVVELPKMSKLALASRFQDSGWKQTAITAKYELAPLAGIDVKLAIGSGEGESLRNLDAQQYGGIEIDANLIEGLFLKLGLSFDGNNVGSESFQWLYGYQSDSRGFSTERQGVAIGLDGTNEKLRGLRLSIGWQKSRITDLDKDSTVLPEQTSILFDPPLDVNYLLVESSEKAVTITRSVLDINAAYRILDTYEIAAAYEIRQIDTDMIQAFNLCSQITATGCTATGESSHKLTQSAYTIGISQNIEPNVKFALEYHNAYFDKLYASYNFSTSGGEKRKSWEVINARVAYNW